MVLNLHVVWSWCVLYILNWKCASCHSSVPLFQIPTFKSAPTLVCFVDFDLKMRTPPQRGAIFHFSAGDMSPRAPRLAYFLTLPTHKSLENTTNSDFPSISRECISFFWLSRACIFFLLLFLCLSSFLLFFAFHLSMLSEVWLWRFLRLYVTCFICIKPPWWWHMRFHVCAGQWWWCFVFVQCLGNMRGNRRSLIFPMHIRTCV